MPSQSIEPAQWSQPKPPQDNRRPYAGLEYSWIGCQPIKILQTLQKMLIGCRKASVFKNTEVLEMIQVLEIIYLLRAGTKNHSGVPPGKPFVIRSLEIFVQICLVDTDENVLHLSLQWNDFVVEKPPFIGHIANKDMQSAFSAGNNCFCLKMLGQSPVSIDLIFHQITIGAAMGRAEQHFKQRSVIVVDLKKGRHIRKIIE